MNNPSIDLQFFTNVGEDFEKRQYFFLGKLKGVKEEFKQNRVYPHLGKLIELQRDLEKLINGFNQIQENGPRRIKKIDILNKRIEFESCLPKDIDINAVEDLIRWSLPLLKETIHEGITICEFVEESIQIENVGIEPHYNLEGYSFVPDVAGNVLHIFRYKVSIFTSTDEKFRTLKTTFIKSIDTSVSPPLNGLKLDLIREFKDLPNPATYAVQASLDIPFEQTLLPVSKRKLLRRLSV